MEVAGCDAKGHVESCRKGHGLAELEADSRCHDGCESSRWDLKDRGFLVPMRVSPSGFANAHEVAVSSATSSRSPRWGSG